jgi:uncharacterized protein YjbI with pentapeptide repeats
MIEIKHKLSGKILFSGKYESIKAALECAVKEGENFIGADLRSASLGGAYLRGARFAGADLGSASLGGADLGSANLSGADLGNAYLENANLRGVYLGSVNHLIDLGQRSDGYRHYAQLKNDTIWIQAACRYFSIADAKQWWQDESRSLNLESLAMCELAEKVAEIRGWKV